MNYDENKRMTLEEIKKVELQLLITFHDFCEKHKLKYVLDGGTLLGAVRHKGFIPWDDDIDVTMPFPDFLKFVKEYRSECDNSDKKILYGDDGYGFHFGKFVDMRTIVKSNFREDKRIYPVWVDIFPMYSIDDDDQEALRKVNQAMDYYEKTWNFLGNNSTNVLKKFYHRLMNDWMLKYYMDKINKIMFEHPYGSTKRIRFAPVVERTLVPAGNDHFDNRIKIEFEGHYFYAPQKYDEYLTELYGDYMKLPPEDQRTTHKINAYWVK